MSTCRDVRRLPSLLCCEGRDYFFPVLFDFNVFSLLPTGGGPACVARRAPPPAASPAPAAEPRPPVPGAGLVHVPRGPARIRSAPGWSDTAERRAHRRPSLWALGAPPLPHSGRPHVAVLRLAVAGGLCGSTEFPFSRRSAFVSATARGPREPQTSPQFCASLPTAVREPAPLGEKCPPHPRPQ